MEKDCAINDNIEEILKEADNIYGFEEGKNILYNYANFIKMKKERKHKFRKL